MNENIKTLVTLTIGHNINDVPVLTQEDIERVFIENTGVMGATFIPVVGYWCGVREESTRIECVTDTPEVIISKIDQLKGALGQEGIMSRIDSAFISFNE